MGQANGTVMRLRFLLERDDTLAFFYSLIEHFKTVVFKVEELYDIIHDRNSPFLIWFWTY